MHVEKRVENRSDHRDGYTACRHMLKEYSVITYILDSSSWIHGAMHMEERVQ